MRTILQMLRRFRGTRPPRIGGDITSVKLLYAKGILFVLAGLLAGAALLAEIPTLRAALLLCLAVWCFARAYYFAFYVVGHYADPGYRFAGLGSFVAYLLRKRRRPRAPAPPPPAYPSDRPSL